MLCINLAIKLNSLKIIFLLQIFYNTNGLLLDSSGIGSSGPIGASSGGGGGGSSSSSSGGGAIYLDKINNLERSIAAVFNKVAYGSTTTKRSIPDNIYVPSLTTVPTPLLTTFRYRDRDKDNQDNSAMMNSNNGQSYNNRNYEIDLERDHVLPTSAPNADILKSNNNPTYPNPNRHHNHERERHRHLQQNSTPAPSGHNLKKLPTLPMFPGDMPSYSPPSRSLFTPPIPPAFQNPFADKPTLRGTNSDSSIINTSTNRRPIPPPSLMPGHERIPYRPPDLINSKTSTSPLNNNNDDNINSNNGGGPISKLDQPPDQPSITLDGSTNPINNNNNNNNQRKKVLNTPSHHNKDEMLMKFDNTSDVLPNSGGLHIPSISRILSGSNGRKEDIPEVLLRTVTVRPSVLPSSVILAIQTPPYNYNGDNENDSIDDNNGDDTIDEEPKTQPKIKSNTENPDRGGGGGVGNNDNVVIYSTQVIQNLGDRVNYYTTTQSFLEMNYNNNNNNQNGGGGGGDLNGGAGSLHHSTISSSSIGGNSNLNNMNNNMNNNNNNNNNNSKIGTWTVAWNIHVYLSAILFTVLAVYSIFKMIFYDKLTHLFNQSYFICIHLILILICLSRIFYLCYDAYNIHLSFNTFLSEILLNVPSTLLTVTFSILILFLLIKSLNNKNNRYSAVMRPLTIIIGCSVHIGLCITLHYVENKQNQLIYNKKYNSNLLNIHPPRILSLICQIIYIFMCLSLGLLYLYLYRILKRVLRNKSQNYIHGYQNLSYAIHITIATALLFVLLASLQIYGAISISTIRPLISSLNSDIDWLQWGYQFSLRLIEIAIITLLSWVTGLKTGASKVLQHREKDIDTHNVSGFALFPCTSSSSQEHFENDYPAVCNANTNLHTYTLRTGKPIYDDNFALNNLHNQNANEPNPNIVDNQFHRQQYDTNSTRSSLHNPDDMKDNHSQIPDHYENPNFELRQTNNNNSNNINNTGNITDNCYSEPINHSTSHNYDFQNFERPIFDRPNSRNEFRASKNLKAMKNNCNNLERGLYENPERRSSNSTHSATRQHNFNNNSFERRNGGVRKSGTLNNIGGIHGRSIQNPMLNPKGVQTLSSAHNLQQRGGGGGGNNMPTPGFSSGGGVGGGIGVGGVNVGVGGIKKPRIDAEYTRNYDNSSNSGGSDIGGIRRGVAPPPGVLYDQTQNDPTQNSGGSSGDSATSGSMLVAEHGFVRFRALDDMGILQNSQPIQQTPVPTARTTGRSSGKEKRCFTNT